MADGDPTKVTLGATEYTLRPQRTGRIVRKLSLIGRALSVDRPPEEITGGAYEALKVFIPDLEPEHVLAGYTAEAWKLKREHDRKVSEAREAHNELMVAHNEAVQAAQNAFAVEQGATRWAELELEDMVGFTPPKAPEFVDPDPDFEDPYEDAADTSPTFPEIADTIDAIYAVNGGTRLARLLGNLVDGEVIKIVSKNLIQVGVSRLLQSVQPPSGASPPTSSGTAAPTTAPLLEAAVSPGEQASPTPPETTASPSEPSLAGSTPATDDD